MSVLLGNPYIIPIPNIKLVLHFKRIEHTEQQQNSKDNFRLVDGRFENVPQKHISAITSVSRIQFTLWSLMDRERKTIKGNNQIDVIYEVPESPTPFPFYALLPFIMFYLSPEQKRPINWFQANKTQNYGIISFSEMKRELENGVGILFQEISQSSPIILPDFLANIEMLKK